MLYINDIRVPQGFSGDLSIDGASGVFMRSDDRKKIRVVGTLYRKELRAVISPPGSPGTSFSAGESLTGYLRTLVARRAHIVETLRSKKDVLAALGSDTDPQLGIGLHSGVVAALESASEAGARLGVFGGSVAYARIPKDTNPSDDLHQRWNALFPVKETEVNQQTQGETVTAHEEYTSTCIRNPVTQVSFPKGNYLTSDWTSRATLSSKLLSGYTLSSDPDATVTGATVHATFGTSSEPFCMQAAISVSGMRPGECDRESLTIAGTVLDSTPQGYLVTSDPVVTQGYFTLPQRSEAAPDDTRADTPIPAYHITHFFASDAKAFTRILFLKRFAGTTSSDAENILETRCVTLDLAGTGAERVCVQIANLMRKDTVDSSTPGVSERLHLVIAAFRTVQHTDGYNRVEWVSFAIPDEEVDYDRSIYFSSTDNLDDPNNLYSGRICQYPAATDDFWQGLTQEITENGVRVNQLASISDVAMKCIVPSTNPDVLGGGLAYPCIEMLVAGPACDDANAPLQTSSIVAISARISEYSQDAYAPAYYLSNDEPTIRDDTSVSLFMSGVLATDLLMYTFIPYSQAMPLELWDYKDRNLAGVLLLGTGIRRVVVFEIPTYRTGLRRPDTGSMSRYDLGTLMDSTTDVALVNHLGRIAFGQSAALLSVVPDNTGLVLSVAKKTDTCLGTFKAPDTFDPRQYFFSDIPVEGLREILFLVARYGNAQSLQIVNNSWFEYDITFPGFQVPGVNVYPDEDLVRASDPAVCEIAAPLYTPSVFASAMFPTDSGRLAKHLGVFPLGVCEHGDIVFSMCTCGDSTTAATTGEYPSADLIDATTGNYADSVVLHRSPADQQDPAFDNVNRKYDLYAEQHMVSHGEYMDIIAFGRIGPYGTSTADILFRVYHTEGSMRFVEFSIPTQSRPSKYAVLRQNIANASEAFLASCATSLGTQGTVAVRVTASGLDAMVIPPAASVTAFYDIPRVDLSGYLFTDARVSALFSEGVLVVYVWGTDAANNRQILSFSANISGPNTTQFVQEAATRLEHSPLSDCDLSDLRAVEVEGKRELWALLAGADAPPALASCAVIPLTPGVPLPTTPTDVYQERGFVLPFDAIHVTMQRLTDGAFVVVAETESRYVAAAYALSSDEVIAPARTMELMDLSEYDYEFLCADTFPNVTMAPLSQEAPDVTSLPVPSAFLGRQSSVLAYAAQETQDTPRMLTSLDDAGAGYTATPAYLAAQGNLSDIPMALLFRSTASPSEHKAFALNLRAGFKPVSVDPRVVQDGATALVATPKSLGIVRNLTLWLLGIPCDAIIPPGYDAPVNLASDYEESPLAPGSPRGDATYPEKIYTQYENRVTEFLDQCAATALYVPAREFFVDSDDLIEFKNRMEPVWVLPDDSGRKHVRIGSYEDTPTPTNDTSDYGITSPGYAAAYAWWKNIDHAADVLPKGLIDILDRRESRVGAPMESDLLDSVNPARLILVHALLRNKVVVCVDPSQFPEGQSQDDVNEALRIQLKKVMPIHTGYAIVYKDTRQT